MTCDTLTAAEQALDDTFKGSSSIELAAAGLRRQLRIQTILIATIGTVLAIEATAIAVLQICYGV